jgi:hypothetical protein
LLSTMLDHAPAKAEGSIHLKPNEGVVVKVTR